MLGDGFGAGIIHHLSRNSLLEADADELLRQIRDDIREFFSKEFCKKIICTLIMFFFSSITQMNEFLSKTRRISRNCDKRNSTLKIFHLQAFFNHEGVITSKIITFFRMTQIIPRFVDELNKPNVPLPMHHVPMATQSAPISHHSTENTVNKKFSHDHTAIQMHPVSLVEFSF